MRRFGDRSFPNASDDQDFENGTKLILQPRATGLQNQFGVGSQRMGRVHRPDSTAAGIGG